MDNINGWILIHKPKGFTSQQIITILKNKFKKAGLNVKKIGHSGTLDPLASGLLLIGLGKATKLMRYTLNNDKCYEFTIKWGEDTTTNDHTGEIIKISSVSPTNQEIEKAISHRFTGEIMQIPPQFSAININGERAYNLARAGKEALMKSRKAIIHSLKLLSHDKSNRSSSLSLHCSSGFYVRSLARDLGYNLGTYAHTTSIKRTKIKNFSIENSYDFDYIISLIENKAEKIISKKMLLPLESIIDNCCYIEISENQRKKIINGNPLQLNEEQIPQNFSNETAFLAKFDNKILSIGKLSGALFSPELVLV